MPPKKNLKLSSLVIPSFFQRPSFPLQAFISKSECEQSTGQACDFFVCDFIPAGKTYEEVCGTDFKNGWQPIPGFKDSFPLEKTEKQSTVNVFEAKNLLLGKWQSIDDPKFTREFTDTGSLIDRYEDKVVLQGVWQVFNSSAPEPTF